MASYKSGFDPPTRPGEAPRSRRQGTYIQPGTSRSEHREADIAHLSGQMGSRRGPTPTSRAPQTGLPRPSMREPSPAVRSTSQTRSKGVAASNFRFGKPLAKPSAPLELKGKSSRNVLRRKPSSIAQSQANPRSATERSGSSSPSKWSQNSAETRPSIETSLKSVEAYNEIFTRPPRVNPPETPAIIPELDRYRTTLEHHVGPSNRFGAEVPHKLATQDLPPPTPLLSGTPVYSGLSSGHRYSGYSGSGYSASPSTRFSESPGPGAYSRDTTPTSMSSQSPSTVAPLRTTTPRLRQGSPAITRPPVTRRRAGSNANETLEGTAVDPQGLPSLLESLTSSSSNSTVKGEHKVKQEKERKRMKKGLSPSPPSPPPRKSSQKFKQPRSEDQESPSKASQKPSRPVMTTSPSDSPLKPRNNSHHVHTKSSPPIRPSREGAPDLQSQLGESMAIIQSNLAGISFSQNRRQSALPSATPTLQPQLAPRAQQGTRLPSRNPSPSPAQPSTQEVTPASTGIGIIPDLRPHMPASQSVERRTPSPSLAITKPRFGLFGRRMKVANEVLPLETKDKAARKGPAAGTGHEGYGRLGLRGRSASATGVGRGRDRSMSAASSSQDSVASTRTHDPFILERMSPVIIAGGGDIIENRNASSEMTRTESNTSLPLGRPSMESKGSSNKSSLSHEVTRTTLWPSAHPRDASKRTSKLGLSEDRRPSDSSDDGIGRGSSLAFRRSAQRLSSASGPLSLARPLGPAGMGVSDSMTSLDASIMSNESEQSKIEMKRPMAGGRKGQLTKPKDLGKRSKSPRKWNFFHRSQPTPKPQPEVAMAVTVGRPPIKPIPHYAMLDSSDEQLNSESMDLEDILNDADVVSLSNEELDALQFGQSKENLRRNEDLHMTSPDVPEEFAHLVSPPLFASPESLIPTSEMPQTDLHLTPETAPVRPSRLPQVGRIPKVISARPQATSPKSFSRPFARLSTHLLLQSPIVLDKESVALGTSPPKLSTPEPGSTEPLSVPQLIGLGLRHDSVDFRIDDTAASHREFLAFSPRKNSETTTSSSGGMSFAGTTAIIPEADAALEEDEVWDEYDDLIDHDDTVRVPVSATSSHGHPFQYESYESRRARKSKMQAEESPTLSQTPHGQEPKEQSQSPLKRSILTSSSIYSTDMNTRLKDALTTIPTPTTPMSFTDFFSGYGDRNNSVHGDSAKKPSRSSQTSSRKSTSSSSHSRRSGLVAITEENNSPISKVNLRVGSMTVSKWLTFGHVLFSPARASIVRSEGSKRHSILVIDGLGNGMFCISLPP